MKNITTIILSFICIVSYGQIERFDYPDTLWVYGFADQNDYGLTASNPIKVGGGILPKHIYRYLNSLTDTLNNPISYERIGSCCNEEINRAKPLTKFKIQLKGEKKEIDLFFDQYEWESPKLIKGLLWKERRTGYYGEYKNDTIFNGFGIYFFKDGGYYKGEWVDGIMQGKGIMYVPDQEMYEGNFEGKKYHGFGILKYPDGGKYVGEWRNDLKYGHGKIYYPPNSEIDYMEGEFEEGNPIGEFKVFKSDGTMKIHEF